MAEQSLDRIRDWEQRTGGFLDIGSRMPSGGSGDGVPF